MKNNKFLLGIIENKIILTDFEITQRNGYKEFTACFYEGEAFDIETIDEEYKRNYLDDLWWGLDDKSKLNYLNDGEQTKEEVFNNWIENGDGYREFKDCSCTDLEIEINNNYYNFETIGAGQHDCRKTVDFKKMIFTNKKAFNLLMNLWDNFHLKEITEKEEKILNDVIKLLAPFDWWGGDETEAFIRNNIILNDEE